MSLPVRKYDVIYSTRSTLAMEIDRIGRLLVRAPEGVSTSRIEKFVEKQAFWIHKKRKLIERQKERARKREYVSGESFPYLGKNYRLDIQDVEVKGLLFHSKFILPLKQQPEAAKLFRNWYKSRAKEKITARVKHWTREMGVSFNRVMISKMIHKWATCTEKQNLNFNWRLIMAPLDVVDYVVVHELAHIIEPAHSEKFWTVVQVMLPLYQNQLRWLEQHGQELEFEL